MSTHTGRAAVYTGTGTDVDITDITVSGPRRGEVLVEMKASGVCGLTVTYSTANGVCRPRRSWVTKGQASSPNSAKG